MLMYSVGALVPVLKPLHVLDVTVAPSNGAQLHKWELDLWPVVVELNLARGRAGEKQDGCRLREPQPTLQLKRLSHPLHVLPLFIHPSSCPCSPLTLPTAISIAIIVAPCLSVFAFFVCWLESQEKKNVSMNISFKVATRRIRLLSLETAISSSKV